MEPDFGGYVTKAGIKCTDGRTITPQAFQHMDGKCVPLMWQHMHEDVEGVLGHAILEARKDGVYGLGFFNNTPKGQAAKEQVLHGDITMMSVFANGLVEKAKNVLHGMIREVSLVLAGANEGAKIDYVRLAHGEFDEDTILDDEAVIYSGETIEILHGVDLEDAKPDEKIVDNIDVEETENSDVWSSLSDEQRLLVHGMLEKALEKGKKTTDGLQHALGDADETIMDVLNTMTPKQRDVVEWMLQEVSNNIKHSDTEVDNTTETEEAEDVLEHKEGSQMTGNVFDQTDTSKSDKHTLTHADAEAIFTRAKQLGNFKEAFLAHVDSLELKHGIDDIEILFPDARNVTGTPEWNKRRTEWVVNVLNGVSHTPFSRIKTLSADITQDQARARGYIKGNYKNEEWFGVAKRTTSPATVYKKQKLDRDDILDITDFDVVAWLWTEIRIMLDEECARAIMIGDGRDVSDEDKIKDPMGATDGVGVRSIVNDHEYYVTTLNVNVDDAGSTYEEVVDAVMDGMEFYKGTGTPTFYTTIKELNKFLKAKDGVGRRLYTTKAEVAAALGVRDIITVEPMNEVANLVGIIVNLVDFNVGMDRGGEINRFDQFNIDYNTYTYLMETRFSGALTKLKSALVVMKSVSTDALVTATKPSFSKTTGVVTIPTVTGVAYKVNDTGSALTAGAQTAIAAGATVRITARPTSGYFFANNDIMEWFFTRDAS